MPGKAIEKRSLLAWRVPPLTPADAPRVRLTLYSERAGSPQRRRCHSVHNAGYKVGRIEVTFDTDKKEMPRYDALSTLYNDLVTTNTRFWNVSGVSIDTSAAGIR